jgi:hypothetical protein
VGTNLRAVRPLWYWIGRAALFVVFPDVALSEKSPYLGSARVRLGPTTRPYQRPQSSYRLLTILLIPPINA